MTTAVKTRIIDGDGHVIEDDKLRDYVPEPYRGKNALGAGRRGLFP